MSPGSTEHDSPLNTFNEDDFSHTSRMRCLLHAFDFRETFRELWEGCAYMFRKYRGLETDPKARRMVIREDLFGKGIPRERLSGKGGSGSRSEADVSYQPVSVAVEIEKEVHVDAEWKSLRTGDDYIYGLDSPRRERTTCFEEQVEIELEKRGLSLRSSTSVEIVSSDAPNSGHGRGQKSWWRRTLDRLSRTSEDDGADSREPRESRQEDPVEGFAHDSPSLYTQGPVSRATSDRDSRLSSTEGGTSPDPVFSRLFSGKATSLESGVPSSQTHASSRGNHVRLTAPANVVPSGETRASEQIPTFTDVPELAPDLEINVAGRGTFARRGAMKPYSRRPNRQVKRLPALQEDDSELRPSRHHREHAFHSGTLQGRRRERLLNPDGRMTVSDGAYAEGRTFER